MITPEMMAFAQKQMANMSPEQIVRALIDAHGAQPHTF